MAKLTCWYVERDYTRSESGYNIIRIDTGYWEEITEEKKEQFRPKIENNGPDSRRPAVKNFIFHLYKLRDYKTNFI